MQLKNEKLNGILIFEDGKPVRRIMPDTNYMKLSNTDNSKESKWVKEDQEVIDFAKKCFTDAIKKEYKALIDAEKAEADKAQAREDKKPKPFTGEMKINLSTWIVKDGLIMHKK